MVTSAADDGTAGTLRWAIDRANAAPGSTIQFNIVKQGTKQTIKVDSTRGALPAITTSVLLDGFSQGGPNNTTTPFVEVSGLSVEDNGLTVNAGGVTIRGLSIDLFAGYGILLDNPASCPGNTIYGCYIGTDLTGKVGFPNDLGGIKVEGANNRIGALGYLGTPNGGSIISGNFGQGVDVYGAGAQSNVIEGNFIGVDVTGVAPLANEVGSLGVELEAGAAKNTVGGITIPGSGPSPSNVISGNRWGGIGVVDANNNQIQSNIIGLRSDGVTVVATNGSGVSVGGESSGNLIGGYFGISGNIISGNAVDGVTLEGEYVSGNYVYGNLIGTASDGITPLGNERDGVHIWEGGCNEVGGSAEGEGNVISANFKDGVFITGAGACYNDVAGNLIGTDESGTIADGNGRDGVFIGGSSQFGLDFGSDHNNIGLVGSHGGNTISDNGNAGVEILNGSYNTVANNYIGTDVNGTAALGNAMYGVVIRSDNTSSTPASGNVIGGTDSTARNIISGNGTTELANVGFGVYIAGGSSDNTIAANYIGLDAKGNPLGNGNDSVRIDPSCPGNIIGGAGAQAGQGAGNVISANGQQFKKTGGTGYGISIGGLYSPTTVQNNIIGLDPNEKAIVAYENVAGWKEDLANQGTYQGNKTQ